MAAVAMPLAAQAAESHPCNQLYDDAQRLGCYDGAFGRPVRPADARPSTPAGAAAATTGVAVASTVPPAPQSAPVPAPAPAPAVAPAKTAEPELPDTITSVITALSRTPDGRFIATLENGQVWLQSERDSLADAKVGDKVTLRKMLFGNYTFVTRTGYTLRVKRVN